MTDSSTQDVELSDLSERTALVTGGSRGIGRAIAVAFGEAGMDVAVNYRSHEDAAEETRERITAAGGRAITVQADVADADAVDELVGTVESEFGPIDVLVNNAGIARQSALDDLTEADWHDHLSTNLTSAFLVTQAVLPGMRERGWGRLINVSSVAARNGGIVGPHYAASKAGMLGLTRSYASRLAGEGVTANAIAPALVETDMVDGLPDADPGVIPVERFGKPEEVADVALMLARNAYVTGQTIDVDGGLYPT